MTTLPLSNTTLYLIRHGETAHNAAGRLQGHLDVPLAERGLAQAAAAAMVLSDRAIEAVWASDLSRARETAEVIATALGLQVQLDSRLREVNVGRWAGLTSAEIASAYPEVYAEMGRHPETTQYPGGESYRGMADRVMLGLADLATTYPGRAVAVVTHGGALRAVMARQVGYEWSHRERFTFENCAILKLTLADAGPRFVVPAPGLA